MAGRGDSSGRAPDLVQAGDRSVRGVLDRHRGVVLERVRRGAGSAATSVDGHEVHARRQRGVEVILDTTGGELDADGAPVDQLADPLDALAQLGGAVDVRETRRRVRRLARPQPAHLGDALGHLFRGQQSAGARLRRLPELDLLGVRSPHVLLVPP